MEESDSERKMEKKNLGPRMDPPIGEPEGSLGWVKFIMSNLEGGDGVLRKYCELEHPTYDKLL